MSISVVRKTETMPVCSMLNVSELKIAEYAHTEADSTSYQRNIKNKAVVNIINDFDPDIMGVILVSHRDDAYYIIDGQHRVEALKRLGKPTIMCQVLTGLTYEEEAAKFEKLNTNRVGLTAVNKFNARIEKKDAVSLSIVGSLAKYGFHCPRKTATVDDNTICCVHQLENVYMKQGKRHFENTLRLLRVCWNGSKDSLQSCIVVGLSNFLYNHGKEFDEKVFVKAMKEVTPAEIKIQATMYRKSPIRAIRDDRQASGIVRVMEDLYNLKAKKKSVSSLKNDFI